jgi:hypothetical protein
MGDEVIKDMKARLTKKAIVKQKLSSNSPQSTPMKSPYFSNNYLKKLITRKGLAVHSKTKSVNIYTSEREAKNSERKRSPLKDEMRKLNYMVKGTHKFKFHKIEISNVASNSLYKASDIDNLLNRSSYSGSVRRLPATNTYNRYTNFKLSQIARVNKKIALPDIKSHTKNTTEYVFYYTSID